MKAKFTYWLNSYKAFSEKQSAKIALSMERLSDKMMESHILTSGLFECNTFIQFAKSRQAINRGSPIDAKEKKALDLYGDFLQFVEYSNFQFPSFDEPQGTTDTKPENEDCSDYSDKLLILGKRVNDLRLDSGLSLEELAQRSNLTITEIEGIEQGTVNAPYLTLLEICSVLKTSVGYLAGEHDDKTISPYSSKTMESNTSTAAPLKTVAGGDFTALVPLSLSDTRKVGVLIKEELTRLSKAGCAFSDSEIASFTDINWSKQHMSVGYAFMKEYNPSLDVSVQRVDQRGNGRYWATVFSFGDKSFLVTSEWYKEDKPFFIRWFNQILKDHSL